MSRCGLIGTRSSCKWVYPHLGESGCGLGHHVSGCGLGHRVSGCDFESSQVGVV